MFSWEAAMLLFQGRGRLVRTSSNRDTDNGNASLGSSGDADRYVPFSTSSVCITALRVSDSVIAAEHEELDVFVERVHQRVQLPAFDERQVARLHGPHLQRALPGRMLTPVTRHHQR